MPKRYNCDLCEHHCKIPPKQYGKCRVRFFDGQKINIRGGISNWQIDFIEKKRLFHFFPGTYVLSLGFYSCNLDCPWCINWEITKTVPSDTIFWDIGKIVSIAEYYGVSGVSFAHSAPEIYAEYIIDTAKKLKKRGGLFLTLSTAGYLTLDLLNRLSSVIDAFVVDLKFPPKIARIIGANSKYYQYIWDKLMLISNKKRHLEITYLPIPGISDEKIHLIKIVKKLVDLGLEYVPFHILRFHPEYKYSSFSQMEKEKLMDLAGTAQSLGIKFVYVADFPNTKYENTYCPNCGQLLIKRVSSIPIKILFDNKLRCPSCNYDLSNIIKWY